MDDRVERQTQCIDEKAFFAFDLLACIVTVGIDTRPPLFSALFTLWLSMMAAVGLASCPSRSRHST
jgi:hypothetical protein